jgi:hypothetical protein
VRAPQQRINYAHEAIRLIEAVAFALVTLATLYAAVVMLAVYAGGR